MRAEGLVSAPRDSRDAGNNSGPRRTANDLAVFLGQLLRSPAQLGAIAPSSRHLARAVCSPVPERGEPVVVELGAGTGSLTAEVQYRLGGRGRHLAIEVNPALAQRLNHRFPEVEVIENDAVHLRQLLAERGVDSADVVISGLPWTLFPARAQQRLVDAIATVLEPTGAFTLFTYLHAVPMASAHRFRDLLSRRFEEVVPGRTIWRNAPPALVLHARRPRP